MADPYLILLVGVFLVVAGIVALTAVAYLYGKPLSRREKRNLEEDRGNVIHLPSNIETIASTAFVLGEPGVLSWSKFSLYSFLFCWLLNLPIGCCSSCHADKRQSCKGRVEFSMR